MADLALYVYHLSAVLLSHSDGYLNLMRCWIVGTVIRTILSEVILTTR